MTRRGRHAHGVGAADLNVSALVQAAIADELQRRATDAWLDASRRRGEQSRTRRLSRLWTALARSWPVPRMSDAPAEIAVLDASVLVDLLHTRVLTTDHRLARATSLAEGISR